MNGVEIDRNRNVGVTSTLKNYVTVSPDRSDSAECQLGCTDYWPDTLISVYRSTHCWDFAKITNALFGDQRYELILIRARNDHNCLTGDPATEPTFELFKVQWRMPHVLLSEINKLSMLCFGKRTISEHGFSLVGSVRVSALAEHNQTFVGHQDGYSAREAALRHFRYANRLKKRHI